MTFSERNQVIANTIKEFQDIHDKYTSSKRILSDQEWDEYIYSMESKLNELKKTTIYNLASELWMSFLNDTEYVQKELKKIEKSRTDKAS